MAIYSGGNKWVLDCFWRITWACLFCGDYKHPLILNKKIYVLICCERQYMSHSFARKIVHRPPWLSFRRHVKWLVIITVICVDRLKQLLCLYNKEWFLLKPLWGYVVRAYRWQGCGNICNCEKISEMYVAPATVRNIYLEHVNMKIWLI